MFTSDDHTFVVCAYGESPYLGECVSSLMSQTVRSNIIISTSTPNNHIQSIANKNGLPLFINSGKPGIAHDWNCAVEHAETSLVTIAHQDDVYLPEYTKKMLECANLVSDMSIFFSDYGELRNGERVTDTELLKIKRIMLLPLRMKGLSSKRWIRFLLRGIKKKGYFASRREKHRLLSFGSPICCPSVTYNSSILPTPLFLDDMKCSLDWETWERFSRLDGSFVYSASILMRHRIHEGSETTASIKDETRSREDLEMFLKFWPKPLARILNYFYSFSMRSNDV